MCSQLQEKNRSEVHIMHLWSEVLTANPCFINIWNRAKHTFNCSRAENTRRQNKISAAWWLQFANGFD